MNLTRDNKANQTAVLTVSLTGEDYKDELQKKLKDQKRNAQIPGFRPGMAPMQLIEKMYRKQLIADLTYNKAINQIFDYLKAEQIDTVGDLMPAEEQKPLDFDKDTDFVFAFEIGLAPKVELTIDKKDVVEKISIIPDGEMVEQFKNSFLQRFGKMVDKAEVTGEEVVEGILSQGDQKIENAPVYLNRGIPELKADFKGKKVGDTIKVDIYELYEDKEQRAAVLGVTPQELDSVEDEWNYEITSIRGFQNPEVNEELFKQAFPNGDVTTIEQFDEFAKAKVQTELDAQMEFKFSDDIQNFLITKANLKFPEEFLKKWLLNANEGKLTMEQIEQEFKGFLDMLSWDMIKGEIFKANELKVEPQDVVEVAKKMSLNQFRQYGISDVEPEMLENFANQNLKDKKYAENAFQMASDEKAIASVVEKITANKKEMTLQQYKDSIASK